VPEERDSLLLFLAHANEHKTREKFSIVTGWEAERVGSRAQVLSDALVRSKQQYCAFRRCHLFKKHSLTTQYMSNRNRNCNRELKISTVSTKAKSREAVYSQALNQNKIDRQRVKIQGVRQDRQTDSQMAMVDGV